MYGIEHKFVSLAASSLILVCLAFSRLATGTFISPASIYAIAWFLFTFIPLLLMFYAPINSLAIIYISASTFVFLLSAVPFDWKNARLKNSKKIEVTALLQSKFMSRALSLSVVASVVLSLATLVNHGFSLDRIFLELLATSGQYAAERGSEQTAYGLIGVLSIFFTYLCPALGGLQFNGDRRSSSFVLSMTPCVLTMLTQSAKIVFLVGFCLYIGGACVASIYSGKLELPKFKINTKIVLGALLLPCAVLVSFVSRLGLNDASDFSDVLDPLFFSIRSYTVAGLYAFADFFAFTIHAPAASVYRDDYHSFGAFSFASIFNMVGIGKEFPPGMYYETAWYADRFETNIFTFFRGLIYDFGVLGSLYALFVLGLVFHYLTHRLLTKTRSWLACSAYIAIVVFILMGYLFSVFVARYIFLNALAVFVVLTLNDKFEMLRQIGVRQRLHNMSMRF